jgi:hypothetical protein
LVEQVAGTPLTGYLVPNAAFRIDAIAGQTLDAAQGGLGKAVNDPGVRYAFYLLTQVATASRSTNWEGSLAEHGIQVSGESSIFDLSVELQGSIDRYLRDKSLGSTDVSEIAQQCAGEALLSLAGTHTPSLFEGSGSDAQKAVRSLSSKKGFGQLGQRFFGRFLARFLNFYLSRITATQVGSPRLRDLGDVAEFNHALERHCDQSARIVRDFCGEWFSKTEHETGINPSNASRFLAVAVKKLSTELEQQRSEP